MPLSISLAVSSEATPEAGIITALWAGLVAAIFGGSNYNIIGPTGALSGFLTSYAIVHGSSTLAMLAIISGIFILIAHYFRLERYLIFVPGSTIHGFTLGVALIIILNQLNFIFGLSGLQIHKNLLKNVIETVTHWHGFSPIAILLFSIFLAALFVFAKLVPPIPAVIILSPIGILAGLVIKFLFPNVVLQTLGTKFGTVHGNLFALPHFVLDTSLLLSGATIAFIAILETLISAKIADGISKTKHNQRKETLGLGLANIISGLLGGIPATAALARTTLNIRSGANSKMSQGISSICIGLISIILLPYFSYMPLPVIAAILVFVAIRMIEAEHFARLWIYDKTNFCLALLVALVTVIEDPILGVIIGSAISLLLFMEKLSHSYVEFSETMPLTEITHEKKPFITYFIPGPLSYINAQAHIAHFESHLEEYRNKTVVINLKHLYFIDLDGIDALHEIIDVLKAHDVTVIISEVNPRTKEILEKHQLIK